MSMSMSRPSDVNVMIASAQSRGANRTGTRAAEGSSKRALFRNTTAGRKTTRACSGTRPLVPLFPLCVFRNTAEHAHEAHYAPSAPRPVVTPLRYFSLCFFLFFLGGSPVPSSARLLRLLLLRRLALQLPSGRGCAFPSGPTRPGSRSSSRDGSSPRCHPTHPPQPPRSSRADRPTDLDTEQNNKEVGRSEGW